MAVTTVSTKSELFDVLRDAKGGDTILLEEGTYTGGWLGHLKFDTEVTIKAANAAAPPVFTAPLEIASSKGLVFENIKFDISDLDAPRYKPVLSLKNSEDITLRNVDVSGHIPTQGEGKDAYDPSAQRSSVIEGYGYYMGVSVRDSKNVTVEDGTFDDLHLAFYIGGSEDVMLDGVTIEEVREGINFFDTQDLTITNSLIQNLKPWLPFSDDEYDAGRHDHPDMIQYWGLNTKTGIDNVTITNNRFIMPEGTSTQTIFGHMNGAPTSAKATNFTITDNLIANGHLHGITIDDVEGAVVSRNVLLPNSADVPEYWAPSIAVWSGRDAIVSENVSVVWEMWGVWSLSESQKAAKDITLTGNIRLSADPNDDNYWGKWLELQPATAQLLIEGELLEVGAHRAATQDEGLAQSVDGGLGLTLSENAWKYVALDPAWASSDRLSFTLSTTGQSEIIAIGLADGDGKDDSTLFQLAGTQTYGDQSYQGQHDGGTTRFDIDLSGLDLADHDRLVFIADDDVDLGGTATFSNISFSIAAGAGNVALDFRDHMPGVQDAGRAVVSSDGRAVTLSDNAWKYLEIDPSWGENARLSFTLTTTGESEIVAVGVATGATYDHASLFQLAGTDTVFNQLYAGQHGAGETNYEINLSSILTGDADRLVFIADDDAGLGGTATFSGISVLDGPAPIALPTDFMDHMRGVQDQGKAEVSSDGQSVTLSENAWKYIDLDPTWDNDAVLSFKLTTTGRSEIIAVGLAAGESYAHETLFQLGGTDVFFDQRYSGQRSASGTTTYEIDLSAIRTEDHDRLVFIADDDAGLGGTATFSDILLI